ncbi:hypothetical protein N0V90_006394 [Kalmusia sp. IMI 367209]|nr:hypothetical protein N0V90_006394 [Kalmusia sp. IMI 367209]
MSTYVIIGASRGLGYQFLKTLSSNSSNTIIGVARTPSSVQEKIKADKLPSNVQVVQGDLTDPTSLKAAAAAVSKLTNGVVDYLIVNGAYLNVETGPLDPSAYLGKEEYFLSELNASIHANAAGVLFSINAFIELVKKSSVKKVIVISTGMADPEIVGVSEVAGSIPYSMSKAAVNILVAKYAVEYKQDGVIFLALSPGMVHTSTDPDNIPPEYAAMYKELTAKFRKYEPSFNGPIRPEESVDAQLNVIHNITLKDSGEFLSHHGNKRWL